MVATLDAAGSVGAETRDGADGADLVRLLKQFEEQQHEIQQLCHFSATAADDTINVELAGRLVFVAKQHALQRQLSEALASDEARALYNLAANSGKNTGAARAHVKALLGHGRDVALAKVSWMTNASGGADASLKVLAWLESFAADIERFVAKLRGQAAENLTRQSGILASHLGDFNEKSTEAAANLVKKHTLNLEMDVSEINEVMADAGEEKLGPSVEAAGLLDKAAGLTMRWGIYQLAYKNKLVRHLEQGAKPRKFLKLIVESYEADFKRHLSEEEQKHVLEILAIGSSSGASASADVAGERATSAEDAGPPKKRARKEQASSSKAQSAQA
jgi:hypothetical protein